MYDFWDEVPAPARASSGEDSAFSLEQNYRQFDYNIVNLTISHQWDVDPLLRTGGIGGGRIASTEIAQVGAGYNLDPPDTISTR
jgi:hypothetical protein